MKIVLTEEKIIELKKKLRKEFIAKRKSIPLIERKEKSKKIVEKLFKTPEFINAKKIMIYHSFKEEVETNLIIEKMHDLKKQVYIPHIVDEKKCLMNCTKLEKETELEFDCYGICKTKKNESTPKKLDLIIVPGIAFDLKGNRIGWGKGFFDRFLKKYKNTPTIGLAFEKQITKKIPTNKFDVKIQKIITEKKIIKT